MKIKLIDYGYSQAPRRAYHNDAGADVFLPEDIVFWPGVNKVSLKFGIELPTGFMAIITSRSSLASQGLVCEIPPIDSGYTGEIHAIVTNIGVERIKLQAGSRIGQIVVLPVVLAEFVEDLGNERQSNGFGSTGV